MTRVPIFPEPASRADCRADWRARLHARLRERPLPLVWTPDALVPAATLWTGARRWITAWRAAAVVPGDRVVLALPPGPGFVMVLVAALWEGVTLAPVAPLRPADEAAVEALGTTVDARVVVLPPGWPSALGRAIADGAGIPDERAAIAPRDTRHAPTPEARLLLRTSGSTGAPRWLACSDANLLAVIDAHAAALAYADATVLSVLPWHHAFGLVIELLPALLAGAELVRDPDGGRDPAALRALAAAHPITHLNAVPQTIRRLAAQPDGAGWLAALRGGVIGGAPVDAPLAALLRTTRLRVGYGQTEAAPGLLLGAAGAWRAGTLGAPLAHPLAPELRLDADGELAFRGPNACVGAWDAERGLVPLDPARWVRTGDLARAESDGTYTFEGRTAHAFKLANGRFVGAAAVERALRAQVPAVHEAVLSSPDGESLVFACTMASGVPLPDAALVRGLLGPLAMSPLHVVAVDERAWLRTPKGEIDRRWPTGRA